MKVRLVVVVAMVVTAACAALAVAQQPPPTVEVDASRTAVSVVATGPVLSGPTRFEVVRSGGKADMSVYVALLVPGVSLEQFKAALEKGDREQSATAVGLVSIQASWSLGRDDESRAGSFMVKPGLTYVVLAESYVGDGPPKRAFTTFESSGTTNGAAAPEADATVRMQGLRFKGDRVLPRNGIVRFDNRDATAHFALAFPLRPGVKARRVNAAFRGTDERAVERVVAGPPTELQGLISGGDTTNYQEVRLGRKGRYALVCFFDGHFRLGMSRVVSVR